MIEINPQVEYIARQYFKLPEDSQRLRVHIEDGAEYMLRGDSRFDAIFLDGFDEDAKAGALDTLPFYRGYKASVERIRLAFDGRYVTFPSCESGNTIAFACAGTPVDTNLEVMREQAAALKKASRLDLLPTITRLQMGLSLPDGHLHI